MKEWSDWSENGVILYYLQYQSASPVLVQRYIANENFIQVGSHMTPYALDRRGNDEQIKRARRIWQEESRGKHTHIKHCCFNTLIRKEEGLHAVGSHTSECSISAFYNSECLTLSFQLHLSLSICDSLPLIKYSQLVPLNIHCAALLRLSALRRTASSECTSSPPKPENTHTHTSSACMACDVAALKKGERGRDD